MDIIKCFSTPISYLINLDEFGLVEGAKNHLRQLSLSEIILLTSDFTVSNNLNQIGETKLALLEESIGKTEEYKAIKSLIK